jgi:hypothetical protein
MRSKALTLIFALFISLALTPTAHAKSIFYLDLARGCYSGNEEATKYLKWSEPDYKKLYAKSCYQPFHYQVYHVSTLTVSLKGDAAQDQAKFKCRKASNQFMALFRNASSVSIGWFFPDPGQEEKKYGKKLICFFRSVPDGNFDLSERQKTPLVTSSTTRI